MLNEHETHPTTETPSASMPSDPARPGPVHPDMLLRAGVALGLVMVAAAFLWVNLARGENLLDALQPTEAWLLVPGLAAGAIFAWVVWILTRRMEATRQIVQMLEATLDLNKITFRHVVLFSLLAAVPEELLFRGAVQLALGLLAASVIFGALHALTRFYFLYATLAGLFLGSMPLLLSGSLWMPIGAHFAIDFVMFMLLLQREQHHLD